jgi:hypothetical protein
MLLRIAAVKYEGRMNSTRVARLSDLLSIGLLLNESADKKMLFPHLKYTIWRFLIFNLAINIFHLSYIECSNEILGWEGVGNRQLLCFFKA